MFIRIENTLLNLNHISAVELTGIRKDVLSITAGNFIHNFDFSLPEVQDVWERLQGKQRFNYEFDPVLAGGHC